MAGSTSKATDEDLMLAELFSLSKSTALGTSGAGKIEMLHYTHEIARKTAEIQQLVSELVVHGIYVQVIELIKIVN